jgi:hypothetical protein
MLTLNPLVALLRASPTAVAGLHGGGPGPAEPEDVGGQVAIGFAYLIPYLRIVLCFCSLLLPSAPPARLPDGTFSSLRLGQAPKGKGKP